MLEKEIAARRRRREKLAAELQAEDAALSALLEAQARLIEAVGEEHRNELLHNPHKRASLIDTMNVESQTRGARLETKHPGAIRMRQIDGSVARFAAKHGLFATTVRSWYATGEAAREIPKKWAGLLAAKPYLIPLTAWRNGVGE